MTGEPFGAPTGRIARAASLVTRPLPLTPRLQPGVSQLLCAPAVSTASPTSWPETAWLPQARARSHRQRRDMVVANAAAQSPKPERGGAMPDHDGARRVGHPHPIPVADGYGGDGPAGDADTEVTAEVAGIGPVAPLGLPDERTKRSQVLLASEKHIEKRQQQAPTSETASALKDSIVTGLRFKVDLRTPTPVDTRRQRVLPWGHRHRHGSKRPDRAGGNAVKINFVGPQTVSVARCPSDRDSCLVTHIGHWQSAPRNPHPDSD